MRSLKQQYSLSEFRLSAEREVMTPRVVQRAPQPTRCIVPHSQSELVTHHAQSVGTIPYNARNSTETLSRMIAKWCVMSLCMRVSRGPLLPTLHRWRYKWYQHSAGDQAAGDRGLYAIRGLRGAGREVSDGRLGKRCAEAGYG